MCTELKSALSSSCHKTHVVYLTFPNARATSEILSLVQLRSRDNVCLNHTGISVLPANSHHTQRASHYCAHTHPRVLTFNDNPTEAVEHKKQVLLEHHILVAMLASVFSLHWCWCWCCLSRWMVRSQSHVWRKPESPVPIRRIGCVQQLLYPGLGEDAARTENAEKVVLQPLPESLPLQSAAADAGPAHSRLTHGDALTIVHRPAWMRNWSRWLVTLITFWCAFGYTLETSVHVIVR